LPGRTWKLSPSDLTFLWEDCRRCFYLKVVKGVRRPYGPMAKIFTLIDAEMKTYYSGRRTEDIADSLPPGFIEFGEKWVESRPFHPQDHDSACYFRGKFDIVARFDDDTYGVIDFKTSQRKAEHIPFYSRQLHAYARALEDPVPDRFSVSPISRLGLLVFEPSEYVQGKTGLVGFAGHASWLEVPRDDAAFEAFLAQALDLLARPEPPPANPECDWCNYRDWSRTSGL
jgi:hypothetical protein